MGSAIPPSFFPGIAILPSISVHPTLLCLLVDLLLQTDRQIEDRVVRVTLPRKLTPTEWPIGAILFNLLSIPYYYYYYN